MKKINIIYLNAKNNNRANNTMIKLFSEEKENINRTCKNQEIFT
jgi:hypothetical protein